MNLLNTEIKKLSVCPKYPEESWRKTNPEIFFLPDSEVLNFQGQMLSETVDTLKPWKISFRDKSIFTENIAKLNNKLQSDFNFISENDSNRIVFINIGHGHASVYLSPELKSQFEFISAPSQVFSVAPSSDIGFGIASRLKSVSPHNLLLQVSTFGSENPLIIIQNHLDPTFTQAYSSIKIVIEKGSKAELVVLEGGSHFSILRHNIVLKENAKLKQLWLNIPNEANKNTRTLLERHVTLSENSEFDDTQVLCPFGTTRVTSNILVDSERARAQTHSAVIATHGHFDYEPIQEHKAKSSSSNLNLKMILTNRAKAIFQGLVKIHKSAPQTQAMQANKNLILSKNAKVDASPRLEILPFDVVCKHGSATGELDNKQVYYLTTRGLTLAQAKKMIVQSFAHDVLSQMDSESTLYHLAQNALSTFLSKVYND